MTDYHRAIHLFFQVKRYLFSKRARARVRARARFWILISRKRKAKEESGTGTGTKKITKSFVPFQNK